MKKTWHVELPHGKQVQMYEYKVDPDSSLCLDTESVKNMSWRLLNANTSLTDSWFRYRSHFVFLSHETRTHGT